MQVLVIGCGYLGFQAAMRWKDSGNDVYAVTRSIDRSRQFRELGLHPIVGDITSPETLGELPKVDIVLFAVGFDRTSYSDIREVYVDGLQNVLNRLSKNLRQLIYISSTGVYGNHSGQWVHENSPIQPGRPGGKACAAAEQLIRNSNLSERSTILRLAGIYGPNRIPRFDAVKNRQWSQLGSMGHINLIHVLDAAEIILEVSRQQTMNQLFLVSDGRPAERRKFYEYLANCLKVGEIDWSQVTQPDISRRASADKKISNQKLIDTLGYSFQFPEYQTGIRQALAIA